MCAKKLNAGFVLVMSLLFMLIVSVLVLGILEIGVLETKMANNYSDKLLSIIQAEKELTAKEILLANGKNPSVGVKVFSNALCGITIYQVNAKGIYHQATTTLISTYAIIDRKKHCPHPPQNIQGRLSWRVST